MELESQPADSILDSSSETTLEDHESASNMPLVDESERQCDVETAPPSPHANSELNPRLALAFGPHHSFFVENDLGKLPGIFALKSNRTFELDNLDVEPY
ncbi:hypothetical protein MSAN_01898900 [Mycena sanguinolenta]|uniref:Uncharacterized protein n=1 Tax=Mycena sanguinolenta TaxID=230812 RepID=A0A8H7CRW8_9AGAR|nr:hypothetical protein MSAN_01898900 [Mycena sanguinolenta]